MFRIFLKTFAVDIAVVVIAILLLCFAAVRLFAQPLPSPPVDALPLPPGGVKPEIKMPVYQQPEVIEQRVSFGLFGRRSRIVQVPRLEASRLAVPFDLPTPPLVDDSEGPWLPRAEQARVRSLWPKSVEFPKGLLFYDLPRRYQSLFTMNNGRSKYNVPTELEDESAKFEVSGGMAHIPASDWNSVKGLAVPTGKLILVWSKDADVRAFALVPRWRWKFPIGTVAVDALFSGGKAFEIRMQTKGDDGWESKVVYRDTVAAPEGFRGAGKACASCHNMPSRIVDVPNRIYRHVVWGDDGRFSWRPFREDGTIDSRWPVDVKQEE